MDFDSTGEKNYGFSHINLEKAPFQLLSGSGENVQNVFIYLFNISERCFLSAEQWCCVKYAKPSLPFSDA